WTRVIAEVVEVRPPASGEEDVIAGRGSGTPLVTPPARLVAGAEFVRRPRRIRVIAHGEYRARNAIQQGAGRDRAATAGNLTVRDIAGADEHGHFRVRWSLRGNERALDRLCERRSAHRGEP